jgi:hypothetical protein
MPDEDFKIKGKLLSPNPYFLDVYKNRVNSFRWMFSDLPKENQFWLYGGETIENIFSLYKAFEKMGQNTFSYHVSDDKNDFADWVLLVYKDENLSTALRECSTPESSRKVILSRLKEMQGKTKLEEKDGVISRQLIKAKEEKSEADAKFESKINEFNQLKAEVEMIKKDNNELKNDLMKNYAIITENEKMLFATLNEINEKIALEEEKQRKNAAANSPQTNNMPNIEGLDSIKKRIDESIDEENAEKLYGEMLEYIKEQKEWLDQKAAKLSLLFFTEKMGK